MKITMNKKIDFHEIMRKTDNDFSRMSKDEQDGVARAICEHLSLNMELMPIDFITTGGAKKIYINKRGCAQISKNIKYMETDMTVNIQGPIVMAKVHAKNGAGQSVIEIGATNLYKFGNKPEPNSIMHAVTKARRRAVLSLAGVGFLTDAEMLDFNTGQPANAGDTIDVAHRPEPAKAEQLPLLTEAEKTTPPISEAQSSAALAHHLNTGKNDIRGRLYDLVKENMSSPKLHNIMAPFHKKIDDCKDLQELEADYSRFVVYYKNNIETFVHDRNNIVK